MSQIGDIRFPAPRRRVEVAKNFQRKSRGRRLSQGSPLGWRGPASPQAELSNFVGRAYASESHRVQNGAPWSLYSVHCSGTGPILGVSKKMLFLEKVPIRERSLSARGVLWKDILAIYSMRFAFLDGGQNVSISWGFECQIRDIRA